MIRLFLELKRTNLKSVLYRTEYPITYLYYTHTLVVFNNNYVSFAEYILTIKYNSMDNSILVCASGIKNIDKYYLSFDFSGCTLGPYDDTLTINNPYDISNNQVITIFNVYDYTVVDPSFISINTSNSITIHFINPIILPDPTHTYVLTLITGQIVSKQMVNNDIIVTAKQTPGSTYPTGILYNNLLSQFYFPLQNNTISLVNVNYNDVGDIYPLYNNFVPSSSGLLGPTNIVNDSSNNFYILNTHNSVATNTAALATAIAVSTTTGISVNPNDLQIPVVASISQIQYSNGQIIVNNNFYPSISNPISMTIDSCSNIIYLLSGISPTYIITQIPLIYDVSTNTIIADSSNITVLSLPAGTLYNPLSITVGQYVPGFVCNSLSTTVHSLSPFIIGNTYLYIGQGQFTNTLGQLLPNQISAINLTIGPILITNQYSIYVASTNLTYPPTFITNKNDGYIYTCDAKSNTISKISITPYLSSIQPYMNTCVYSPNGLSFDASGVLYVSNGGTNPNNNKITKIYVDYFEFFNVELNKLGVTELYLYDVTIKSFVPNGIFNLVGV